MDLGRDAAEMMEILHDQASLPAYLYRAPSADRRPAPSLVRNGFNSFEGQLLG